jgi:cell fate (sporulation/competence/biofilm development) regulator YmcA (YheA/YmcA/DUF963 family)
MNETKRKADELVNQFKNLNRLKDFGGMDERVALDCAIICQEREVKNNDKHLICLMKYGVNSDAYRRLKSRFNESQEILTELKSRL